MSSLTLLAVFEFLGRVFVAQLFVIGGFRKVTDPARVKQQITDAGIPFDPFAREPFVEAESLAQATVTGRGIHLIRSFTDEQKYRRLENGNTIRLTLYKSNRATRPATSDQPSPPLARGRATS